MRTFGRGTQAEKTGDAPSSDKDVYKADFTHNNGWEPQDASWVANVNTMIGKEPPVFDQAYNNRQLMFYPPKGLPIRTEMDRKKRRCLLDAGPQAQKNVQWLYSCFWSLFIIKLII